MLAGLLRGERAVSTPWNDTGWGVWPGSTGINIGGVTVNEATASQLMAVYGSASLITDEISTLPVNVDGRARRPMWVDYPSEGLDRIAWLGQVVWSLLIEGNAYLAKIGDIGSISALDPLDPAKCDVVLRNGRKTYLVNGEEPRGFTVVHIPGRMRPGDLKGMSPVEEARLSIGLGLSAQKFGAEFFENEGNMPGVIEAPSPLLPEQIKSMATAWRNSRRRGGRGMPGVLQAGATWKATAITNEQAQFLATRQFTAAEIIGSMFHLDPSDLGQAMPGSSMTYANLQQRVADRTQKALMPWIRRIESQLSQLLPPGAEYRFDVDSRLRGNTKESYETLEVAVRSGFMTENEARSILGYGPLETSPSPSSAAPDPERGVVDEVERLRAEMLSVVSREQPAPINVNVDARQEPPVVNVDARQEPPVVNVQNRQSPPVVNMAPTPVTVENIVNVEPTPVDVSVTNDVQPAPVEVRVVDPKRRQVKFNRDPRGEITSAEVVES